MNIKPCPSCGKEVSAKAYDCPHCGHPIKKPRRGFFGVIFKYAFIAFNVLMLLWVIGGTDMAVDKSAGLDEAQLLGHQIGTGIAISMLLTFWAIGDIILGLLVLLTRPSK